MKKPLEKWEVIARIRGSQRYNNGQKFTFGEFRKLFKGRPDVTNEQIQEARDEMIERGELVNLSNGVSVKAREGTLPSEVVLGPANGIRLGHYGEWYVAQRGFL